MGKEWELSGLACAKGSHKAAQIEDTEEKLTGKHSPKITLDSVNGDKIKHKDETDAKAAYIDQEDFCGFAQTL